MNKKALGKVVLAAYCSFEKIAQTIGDAINKKSMLAAGCTHGEGFIGAFDDICFMLMRKTQIINAKIACETTLSKLKPLQAQILCLKFLAGSTNMQICEKLQISERAYFRHLANALDMFGKTLSENGLDDDSVQILFKSEPWILKIYKKCS